MNPMRIPFSSQAVAVGTVPLVTLDAAFDARLLQGTGPVAIPRPEQARRNHAAITRQSRGTHVALAWQSRSNRVAIASHSHGNRMLITSRSCSQHVCLAYLSTSALLIAPRLPYLSHHVCRLAADSGHPARAAGGARAAHARARSSPPDAALAGTVGSCPRGSRHVTVATVTH